MLAALTASNLARVASFSTTLAQALASLQDVRGLVFFGFPLHPAGKPSVDRAAHLASVRIPMLFLQGTRDALADITLVETTVRQLGPPASLTAIQDADHSFHVPARSGRTDRQVLEGMLDQSVAWMRALVAAASREGREIG